MAKQKKGLFELSGTIGGITFVHTKRGTIVRRTRGSIKKAVCNERLQEECNRNGIVNSTARLVHDFIARYAKSFKQSNLWQQMQRSMRKSFTNNVYGLLQTLEGMEINPNYPMHKIAGQAEVLTETAEGIMTVEIRAGNLSFTNTLNVDCFYAEATLLFGDDEARLVETIQVNTDWLLLKNSTRAFITSFEIPAGSRNYALLLKVQGGKNEKAIEDKRTMAIRLMKVGGEITS